MATVDICITVELRDEVNSEQLAEKLFDFLSSDPDDIFPEIAVVIDYQVEA